MAIRVKGTRKLLGHFRCMVSYCYYVTEGELDQYAMGFGVSSRCFWSETKPICSLEA